MNFKPTIYSILQYNQNIVARYFFKYTADVTNASESINKIVIIGDSWTAAGVAQLAVKNGFYVTFINQSSSRWFRPYQYIHERLKEIAHKQYKTNSVAQKKFISESMNRLELATCPRTSLKCADIVVAAIASENSFENFLTKRKLLKQWSSEAHSNTKFAFAQPTKSPFNVSFINKMAVFSSIGLRKRRTSVIEINIASPVPVLKIAEIVGTRDKSQSCIKRVIRCLKAMEITPVVVKHSGELNDNLIRLKDLMHLVEKGSMTIGDIDLITKLGKVSHVVLWLLSKVSLRIATYVQLFMVSTTNFSNKPIGPFEMADYIGLDKAKFIIDEIHMESQLEGGEKYKESQLLKYLIKEGKLGRKTGEGFYSYTRLPCDRIIALDRSRDTFL